MRKRRLGRTGLQVSVIGFGGIPIISASRDEAENVVKHAFERGINYFDTARNYGDSEEKMGAALKDVRDSRGSNEQQTEAYNNRQEPVKDDDGSNYLEASEVFIFHLHSYDGS